MLLREIFSGEYFYANRMVFELEISGNAKLVYYYLAKCADVMGKCWPAHKTIAAACSLSVTAVKTALTELMSQEVITISNRSRENGGKSSNLYMLLNRDKRYSFAAGAHIFARRVSAKAKLIFLYLCRCAGKKTASFPAHKTIAELCAMGLSTVRKALLELLTGALVAITTRCRENGGQTSNLYTLLSPQETALKTQEAEEEKISEETVSNEPQNQTEKQAAVSENPFQNQSNILQKNVFRTVRMAVSRMLAGGIGAFEHPSCSNVAMKELSKL